MDIDKRILVVDDEEQMIFVLKKTLAKLKGNYEIATARNGEEALEKIRETPFDLVITDIMMPGMDGIQLTEAIHNMNPDTRVIWLTAYGSQTLKSESQRLGVHRYLAKPMDVNEIVLTASGERGLKPY